MIWKLTDQVWWGDRFSLQEADEAGVRSNIDVAHQLRRMTSFREAPSPEILRMRLPINDKQSASDAYMTSIWGVVRDFISEEAEPILVNCFAGGHRSPGVAVFVALCRDRILRNDLTGIYSQPLAESLRAKMLELHPTVRTTRGIRNGYCFHASLWDWILKHSI